MSSPDAPIRENRLSHETSPYLLQHKTNPVEWWPWGSDALAEAQRSGRPILLSVGYAACHWCHVMAHESFEDPGVAAVMNELFVNIKVDREERPDIDQIYMSALHLLGEQGGWPLTMFLTSRGEPFWGGTYFPREARYGRPAFVDVLREVARLYRIEPHKIDANRSALMDRLSAVTRPEGRVVIGARELDGAAAQIGRAFDPDLGGLRGAPKFPQASIFELLWRTGARRGDDRFYELIERTLDRICEGGIYDHLGGGFARYSVDDRWLVPHFEKMLYDNAQLLELLALAAARSGRRLFRDRAHETVDWLAREMTMPEGGFASSLDADSEGEEGKFYVWTQGQVSAVLGADAPAFMARYDITPDGNFEGHSILNRLKGLPPDEADEERLAAMRARLLYARSARIRPSLDDKVLADWNGLMIAALANAGALLDQPTWVRLAARAFGFVATAMTRGDRLGHSWRDGRLLVPGLASDYAAMIRAALALFEGTGERPYLAQALAWQRALDRHYVNSDTGGYYLTADDAEDLVVRPNAISDDATPNPNALAAQNLVRLAVLAGDDRWRTRADRLFDGLLPLAAPSLFAHAALLNALDLRLRAAEIVVAGTGPRANALLAAARHVPFIDRILVHAPTADTLPASHPSHDKVRSTPEGAAFVCVAERCSLPVTAPGDLGDAIAAMRTDRHNSSAM